MGCAAHGGIGGITMTAHLEAATCPDATGRPDGTTRVEVAACLDATVLVPELEAIDTHLHCWEELAGYSWLVPELAPLYRQIPAREGIQETSKKGYKHTILVQAADTLADTEYLLTQVARWPEILGAVCWVPLTDAAWLTEHLPRLQQRGLVGVRELIHDQPDTKLLDRADYREGLAVLAQCGVPFEVPDAFPAQLPAATRLAAEMPQLTVVLDHLGKPPAALGAEFTEWECAVREFAAQPNTVAKLSGLHHGGVAVSPKVHARAWEVALQEFGPKRLLLGSDYPMPLLGDGYTVLHELTAAELLKLPPEAAHVIAGGTARRVYRLG
ncbi:hydrolase [Leucobacter sp. OH2974_COT-288]|nr:hydrolase [Leucobacter sp. OH2974_COT-288]